MFFRKKKSPLVKEYDRENKKPVIRCSICTGEETAGFQDRITGRFTEDRLIRSQADLKEFMEEYGLTETPEQIY